MVDKKIRVRIDAECEVCEKKFSTQDWVHSLYPWNSLWQTLSNPTWAGELGVLCCGKECADKHRDEEYKSELWNAVQSEKYKNND